MRTNDSIDTFISLTRPFPSAKYFYISKDDIRTMKIYVQSVTSIVHRSAM